MTKTEVSVRLLLTLLGLMAAAFEIVPYATMFMRLIQMYLILFWEPSCCRFGTIDSSEQTLEGPPSLVAIQGEPTKRSPTKDSGTRVCAATDASEDGWGAHLTTSRYMDYGMWCTGSSMSISKN